MAKSIHKYRPDIDGLRAVAVLSVLIFHAFPTLLPGGFVGVDVFFVISGYLISRIILSGLNENTFTIGDFYSRRIKRIFPALTLTLAASLLVGWFFLYQDEMKQLAKHVAAGAGFISNLVLWREAGYFDTQSEFKPLLHLWSLGIEEQFYLIWPLLLYWAHRTKSNPFFIVILTTGLSFLANILLFKENAATTFYFPLTRFWELGLGGLLAHVSLAKEDYKISEKLAHCLSFLGLALILSAILIINKDFHFPGWWATLPVLGSILVILAGPSSFLNRWVLSNKLMVSVGLISYPLYLWHWPILSYLRIVLGGNLVKSVASAALVLSFGLAWMTYYFVEKKLRHRQGRPILVNLSSVMIVLASFGLMISTGIISKNTSSLSLQLARTYETGPAYRYQKCFLDSDKQAPKDFSDECLNVKNNGKQNLLVMLWGDSHAAHLYPGIKKLQEEIDFNLVQRTATSCPPLIGGVEEGNGSCPLINEANRKYISDKKPDVVVLGSRWSRDTVDLEAKLTKTIEFLHSVGVKQIIVFGPPPQWLPQLKYILLRKNISNLSVPETLNPKADDFGKIVEMDHRLKEITKNLGVRYISVVDNFCENDKCIVRVGTHYPDDLISSDSDHFTQNASIYLLTKPEVMKEINKALGG